MPHELAGPQWQQLASAGFVHVPGFLGEPELARLRNDYQAQYARGAANGNYDVPLVSPLLTARFESRLQVACTAIRSAVGIEADMTVSGLYFATEKGISFSWHQDHESYFIYQQHSNYLNFYIPVVKPELQRSNLCLVPFDQLRRWVPDACLQRLVGAGATRFYPERGSTRVCDDEHGDEYLLPVDIEELKVTPQLQPGDLLLLRGDMIHRTQDTETARISVSLRRTSSTAPIKKARLTAGAVTKQEMMRKNAALYGPLLDCFVSLQQEEISARQLASYYMSRAVQTAACARSSS